jgi:hypothetical protein
MSEAAEHFRDHLEIHIAVVDEQHAQQSTSRRLRLERVLRDS